MKNFEKARVVFYFDNFDEDKLETLTMSELNDKADVEVLLEVAEAINTLSVHEFAHLIIEESHLVRG